MLIGNVYFERLDGKREPHCDTEVSPDYAERASREDQEHVVVWVARNGRAGDVRRFFSGIQIDGEDPRD